MASDAPNMDDAAIRERLAEKSAVLFDDRTRTRRRKLAAGDTLKVLSRNGEKVEPVEVSVGTTYTDSNGKRVTVSEDTVFKRPVRVLVRQWRRIPDREREPLYRFLRRYASAKNSATTCWVESPMVDGEELPGFWKMLRTWESRYRPQDPAEQGVFQALMHKGDWEVDNVPPEAWDDDSDGDAGACVQSSPLHHIDREIHLGASDVPSCGHNAERGHIYEASGSFNEEDGTFDGHIDDDIARDPGDFFTWSGAHFAKRVVRGGTHKDATAIPTKGSLEARLIELGGAKKNYYGTEYPLRDIFGRPRDADGKVPGGYRGREAEFSPLEYFEQNDYPDVMGYANGEAKKKVSVEGFGVTLETSADLDNYGLFSVREHSQVAENRRFYMRDGGHIHDSWTYKGYKSAWLPIQNIEPGCTLQLMADLDEDGLFDFVKTVTFAHPWSAWHAKEDSDSWTVVFEFHNRAGRTVPEEPEPIPLAPAVEDAIDSGAMAIARNQGRPFATAAKDLIKAHAIVSGDYDKNEFGLYDGRWIYVFPKFNVTASLGGSSNKYGGTGKTTVIRNVIDRPVESNNGKTLSVAGVTYGVLPAGKTRSWRATMNDFDLWDVTVQENNLYPEGIGEVASYNTRQAKTKVGHGWKHSKYYCYSAGVTIKRFTSESAANAAVSAAGWNEGSSVNYEGNGVWLARIVRHKYDSNANDPEVRL